MAKKLLHKTLQSYIIFSVVILLTTAPLFYFLTQKLYLEDAEESLMLSKNEFLQLSLPNFKESDVSLWNKFNRDSKIYPSKNLTQDTLFDIFYVDSLTSENEPYRELNSPIFIDGKPYTFVVKINLVESEDLLINIVLLFFILITLLLIGLFLITKRLSNNIWKPFYTLLQQIELFEIDKENQLPYRESNIEEFNRLNQSIEKLVNKNLIIYKSQREFIENAAHELQTPLAIFQSKIDNLLQRSDITKEQSTLLESLNHSVSRLNRLNKNLLLLSKIDSYQFSDVVNFSLKELIEKHLVFFKEQAQSKNIEINIQFNNEIDLKANIVLTEILINNLFLNAIRHNVVDGNITIILYKNELTFSNTGKSETLLTDNLFARFSKSNSSQKGNGLGLAIIKKITELNNWTITYSYSDNSHSFVVHF
ncbi:MAG: HAMP domain-containing histidine kinase [Flavobacteriales bacterium]|nr:HAMP domain-containing histidine kinase [Flavobacteriales bacterium]MCB9363421.1 HAMP domain-containing histidine kinase [Flavobacteriales bacterium]